VTAAMKQSDALRQDREALHEALITAGFVHVRNSAYRCAFHDDARESAGVYERDGVWRVKCHGCNFGGDVFDVRAKAEGRDVAEVLRETNATANGQHNRQSKTNPKRKIVATYDYVDSFGALLYQTVRYHPKDFRQRQPDGNSGWIWNMKGVDRVLYRLPEINQSDAERFIFVVEGEKSVDYLNECDLCATTTVGGAEKAHFTDLSPLHGRHAVVIPDADAKGRNHAQQIAKLLHGKAASIRVVDLPDRSAHQGADDWLTAGNEAEDLVLMADGAPEWEPATTANESESVPAQQQTNQPGPDEAARSGKPYMRTDFGNAERFVARYGDRIRWCEPWGCWLVYDAKRWATDNTGLVERLAKKTVRAIFNESALVAQSNADGASNKAQALATWAKTSESNTRIASMVRLARSEAGIPVVPDELDADPWLLNVRNGTLNLRTGELESHNRADLLTKLAPVNYNPDSDAPVWRTFLNRIFADDQSLIDWVQRWFGHCLTGDTCEHVLPVLHGTGANGKTTMLEAIHRVLGDDYSCDAAPELLIDTRRDEHPTELADLHGRRLVVCSESEKGRRLKIQLMKRLTGDSTIKARFMRQDYFQFRRQFKTVLVTNNRPRVDEDSEAVWRRIRLVPFNVVIPTGERDKTMPDKLAAEAEGILAWLVEGCRRWLDEGLPEPSAIQSATDAYRTESDPVGGFFDECCTLDHSLWTKSNELRQAYEQWASEQGVKPVSGRDWSDALKARDCEPKRVYAGRGWQGIGLVLDEKTQNERAGA